MTQQIHEVFQLQQAHKVVVGRSTVAERKRKLQLLIDALSTTYRKEIHEALYRDFGKPATEADLTEVFAVVSEIKHIKRSLHSWMRDKSVSTPLPLLGSSSWVRQEPKGVTLIISPWNFPVLLTFGPLASAIAAGNTAILKPSEVTPHTSALMARMVIELFEPQEVVLFEGTADVSTELLKLPFDHIFFTGSPAVGKVVMRAAAENLTSITLELGGKSPTIVDETADIKTAASRIAWAKMLNAGQICIAPDYVLVHEAVKDAFVAQLTIEIQKLYGAQPEKSGEYTQMSTERHHARVATMLTDSVSQGAKITCGGTIEPKSRMIAPTVVVDAPLDSPLMQHEIFGPVLPVVGFKTLEEACAFIQSKEKPLALYLFSTKRKNQRYILENTRAGGTCINHCAIHFFNSYLPFGGVRFSGQGKGHGLAGFQEFSNARAVFKQHIMSITDLIRAPYAGWKQVVLNLAIRWL
jgi:aldehyde dehydrogenase (NAD+)